MAKKNTRRPPTESEKKRHQAAMAKVKKHEKEMLAEAREVADRIRAGRQIVAALREERQRQGVSLADLMERTGMQRSSISALENDDSANPTVQTLSRLAAALGMNLEMKLTKKSAG